MADCEHRPSEPTPDDPDAPWFICDRCKREVPIYLGRYRFQGFDLCHGCYDPDVESDEP